MPTHIAPIQITISPGNADEFIIGREHQLEDATFTLSDMFADHFTQESESAADKSFSGLESSLEISIADIGFEMFKRATNFAKYTVNNDGSKRKLEYSDLTGLRVIKKTVLIKLYEGFTPTLNKDNWFTFPYAGIEVEASLSFGKTTQAAYTMRIVAYPDPTTNFKVVRGDTTAFSTLPPTVTLANPGSINAGQTVILSATATANGASIVRVEFFVNGIKLGEDTANPYVQLWTPTAGTFTLTARATDNNGLSSTSSAIIVTVGAAAQNKTSLVGLDIFS